MLRMLSSAALVALSAPAWAQGQQPSSDREIVVTGERIHIFRDRLSQCLARNCRPDEDIQASTALAEVLVLSGDYREARKVLRASVGRNHDEAKGYPEPVSNLYRADARVARHLGMDEDAKRSSREILRALTTGIPVEDQRHFTARLEIAQAMITFGRYDEAQRRLNELQEVARRAGRKDIATMAELQNLWVSYQRGHWTTAKPRLNEMKRSANVYESIGAKLLLIRIHSERREKRQADALLAELGAGGQKRGLLFEPEYQLLVSEEMFANTRKFDSFGSTYPAPEGSGPMAGLALNRPTPNLGDRVTDNFEGAWIDVSFRIKPDGLVHDLQVIRRGPGSAGWEDPLVQAINGRRYTAGTPNQETLKIERYTYTSPLWRDSNGSRMIQRSQRARVEKIDLGTVDIPA